MACLLCAVGTAAMSVPAWITGLPAVVPSLGASVLAAAAFPDARESGPASIALGHAIAVVATLGTLATFGLTDEPSALVAGVSPSRMVAVPAALALTLAGMLLAGRIHVPAGATTLVTALGIVRGGDVAVLLASVLVVAATVALFPRLEARLVAPRRAPRRATPRR
jgi:hypothetical protein